MPTENFSSQFEGDSTPPADHKTSISRRSALTAIAAGIGAGVATMVTGCSDETTPEQVKREEENQQTLQLIEQLKANTNGKTIIQIKEDVRLELPRVIYIYDYNGNYEKTAHVYPDGKFVIFYSRGKYYKDRDFIQRRESDSIKICNSVEEAAEYLANPYAPQQKAENR